MPYTLAHPAAVLPIWYGSRRRFPLAPLLIGAASPDFEFFASLNTSWTYSHTLIGLFTVCLPTSLIALWLFNRWGRLGAAALLPREWSFPLTPTGASPVVIVLAILAGGVAVTLAFGIQLVGLGMLSRRPDDGPLTIGGRS